MSSSTVSSLQETPVEEQNSSKVHIQKAVAVRVESGTASFNNKSLSSFETMAKRSELEDGEAVISLQRTRGTLRDQYFQGRGE